MKVFTRAWVIVLASACVRATPPPAAPPPAVPAASRGEIVPVADYHVHLLGPYALPLPDPLPAEVTLPDELNRLLAARAGLTGNVASEADLDSVFTEDAQLLDAYINPTGWMRDKYWFMRYINLAPPASRRRYVPNAYQLTGNGGFIAGTILDVPSRYHIENFMLAVRRGADGRWRIVSEAATRTTPPRFSGPVTAARLIQDLDEAGIQRAVVLSEAFWLGEAPTASTPRRMTQVDDPIEAVRRENDWTAEQVARYPGRLVMACGINPLRDFAVAELIRCSRIPQVVGMKMNFGDAGVDYANPEHIEKLRRLFAAANEYRMVLIIHAEPGRYYGPAEVELFLDRLVSAAPDVPIQIAHMAGNGPGITSPEALEAFAKARAAGDPRTRNLYFDFGGLVHSRMAAPEAALMVQRMREIGLDRILFGSDALPGTPANPTPAQHWAETRRRLPLTDDELRIVAGNITPYLRKEGGGAASASESGPRCRADRGDCAMECDLADCRRALHTPRRRDERAP